MVIVGLFVATLIVLGLIFKHAIPFSCIDNWPYWACTLASQTLVALYAATAALALVTMLVPAKVRALVAETPARALPVGLFVVGVIVALIPVAFLRDGAGQGVLLPAFVCWTLGMGLILVGTALAIARLDRWRVFWRAQWQVLLPATLAGLAVPQASTLIRPLWQVDQIAAGTFNAVARLVVALGYQVDIYFEDKVIGYDDFFIDVAPQCSGVEGIALVCLFVTIYLTMFRHELRFPRALLLYPAGIAASVVFNVVRIATLLILGLEGHHELAVDGFHSHAGWLMFTLVAFGVIALARTVPALQKELAPQSTPQTPAPVLPFFQDPVVARIFPFLVFMATALLASTFSQNPAQVYPLRALAVAAALLVFLPVYRRLEWAPGVLAWGVGIAIGVAWVVIPYAPPEDGTLPYGTLTGGLLIGWFVARGIGTIVLVPVLEELFFRDYLPKRLAFGTGRGWMLLGIAISALAFAALHGRWAEALAAAVALHWLYHRTGRITDAILAHAVANAVVFGVALLTGQMHII